MAVAGLYDPRFEHDACGVGFVADLSGRHSHAVVARALKVLGLKRLPRDVTPTLQSYLEAVRRTDTIDADEDEARTD